MPALYPAHLPPVPPRLVDPGHPAAGLLLVGSRLMDRSAPSGLMRGWTPGARHYLLQPIFGHHGRPVPVPETWQPEDWRPVFPPACAAAALADWIGSNQAWFPYAAPETDLPAYWDEACRRAEAALHEAGLVPARPARPAPSRISPACPSRRPRSRPGPRPFPCRTGRC